MRKVKILVAAALMAIPMGAVTAQSAAACPTHGGCPGACHVNKPVTVEGDQITISDRPLIECYY
jgi:hypothetical protein